MLLHLQIINELWSKMLLWLILLSFYYLSYRYPLQINDSNTSPIYRDTPFILQIGKYAIFAGLIYVFVLFLLKFKSPSQLKKRYLSELSMSLYLFIMSILYYLFTGNDYLLQTGLFFILLLLYYFFPFEQLNYKSLTKVIKVFVYIAIIFEIYQVLNYQFFNRLPALGYYGSISVRFGSVWDDPNSFAMIIPFLFSFVLYGKDKLIVKIILCLLLIFSLVSTQSLTGVATFICAFPIGFLILLFIEKSKRRVLTLVNIGVVLFVSMLVIYVFIIPSDFFKEFMNLKQDSISDHFVGLSYLKDAQFAHLLGFNSNPQGKYAETGYFNLLLNFGILFAIFYVIMGVKTIIRLGYFIKNNRDKKYISIFYAAFFFVIAFFIGLTNLPLEAIFPLNIILVLCYLLSYSADLEEVDHSFKKRKKYKIILR